MTDHILLRARILSRYMIAGAITVAAAASAWGAGVRVGFMDAFAITRGNAFAATADSPSAIFYNPGGLTQIEGREASAGSYLVRLRSEYTTPDGEQSHSMRDSYEPVPHLYFATTREDLPVTIGLGAYMPFGLLTEWPDEAPIAFQATRSELRYIRLNPVASWRIADGLSVGGGPTFNFARVKLGRKVLLAPQHPADPNRPLIGDYRFEGDDTAIGFNAGVHWQPHPRHAFGLSYHSPTRIRFDGTDEIRSDAGNAKGDASIDRLTFPEIAIAGYSYRPTPDWNLEFNLDWTRASRFDSTTVRSGVGDDQELDLQWKDTFFYGFGITRYLPRGYHLNAGYLYTDHAVPSDSFWAAVPDSTLHFFSLGIGGRTDHVFWHLGYHYGRGVTRNIPGDPMADGAGRYENRVHGPAFTLTASF